MMKNSLFPLTLIAILFTSCSDNPKETKEDEAQTEKVESLEKVIKSKTEYQYGAELKEGSVIKKNGGGYFGIFKDYKYNEEGKEIEVVKYNKAGTVKSKYTTDYNSDGNRIKQTYYDNKDIITSSITYNFDGNGNNFEKISLDANGDVRWKIVNTFDASGYEITSTSYDSNGIEKRTNTNSYDGLGNCTESIMTKNESFLSKDTYTYDKHNNKTSSTSYDKDGGITSSSFSEHTYNENDDIVKSIWFYNDKPSFILEMEIKY